ncbi:toxin-antitoxin system YwqK family antitoxin [Cellulophaga sp. Z1A5H]|uniref:toxin-antitoxin system YwqK family antitoxin n=1 Tax=Cellulophaga sp. Z1A5H TaxID=2687291 RepID=UPI0013FE29A4|nr:hypothetical protein [Cellulophaga sp. Z1A5H]
MLFPKTIHILIIFLCCCTLLHAQKETREITQHPTLGEVTLVTVYEYYTDTISYAYFEKNTTLEDPIYGNMNVVGEYNNEGELTGEIRIKAEYNDPTFGLVRIEQEYDEGELDTDYKIKKKFKDPDLGIVNVVMSFYEGELEETFKYKKQTKEDATLGMVETTVVYDEEDLKDRETITYGTTTIDKSFYKNKLTSEVKTYADEHNNYIRQEKKYYNGTILTKELSYKNGKIDGLEHHFYTDGVPQLELNYKEGKKIGVQKTYHSNGQLNEEETIDENGKRNGTYVHYKYDGSLTTKGSYIHGKKTGTWEEYDGHNPNLLKKCTYTGDSATCEEMDYYDHGAYFTIKSVTTLTQDQSGYYKNGPYTSYYNYKKNLIKNQGVFKNGAKFGVWVTRDKMGNTVCSLTYLADHKIINQEFASYYEDDGTLSRKGSNVPDYSCGGETELSGEGYLNDYDHGTLSSEKKYFDGTLVAEKMYKYGVLTFEREFKNEKKIGLIAYDDKKRIKYALKMRNDTTYLERFQYNEKELKIKDKGFIVDKQKEPYTLERTVTYASGALFAQGMVVVDTSQTSKRVAELSDLTFLNTGVWKSYYKDGTLESIGEYKNNQPVGIWKSYYENGALKIKGTYQYIDKPDLFGRYKSIKIGVWSSYHKEGSIDTEKDFKDGL